MELLISGGAFIGALLGRYFKVLVLVPVGALAIVFLVINHGLAESTLFESLLGDSLLIASLELGYVTRLIWGDISTVADGICKLWQRPRRPWSSRQARPK
jgi:hypothetical protein